MNQKQTKLIEQAATVETDGEGWRKRMERWLEAKRITWLIPQTYHVSFADAWKEVHLKPKRFSKLRRLRLARRMDIALLNGLLGTSYK